MGQYYSGVSWLYSVVLVYLGVIIPLLLILRRWFGLRLVVFWSVYIFVLCFFLVYFYGISRLFLFIPFCDWNFEWYQMIFCWLCIWQLPCTCKKTNFWIFIRKYSYIFSWKTWKILKLRFSFFLNMHLLKFL